MIFLDENFFEKNRLNFDIQKWLKVRYWHFWQTVITRRNYLKNFLWWHVDSWPKSPPSLKFHDRTDSINIPKMSPLLGAKRNLITSPCPICFMATLKSVSDLTGMTSPSLIEFFYEFEWLLTHSLLICTWCVKNQFRKIKFNKLDF